MTVPQHSPPFLVPVPPETRAERLVCLQRTCGNQRVLRMLELARPRAVIPTDPPPEDGVGHRVRAWAWVVAVTVLVGAVLGAVLAVSVVAVLAGAAVGAVLGTVLVAVVVAVVQNVRRA